ncbi:glycosyltransferase family 4 protein [Acetobacter conturbans]|uniref:Glycosyltransferase n=1 Tax=Acetobacter conturbans TaxID=1737472 RepID=A0ABX0K0H9_9PROT|nr:glycosyltransferase family 4 protein [Acetobacter conturbans]NHN88770.1 glycosyltransferase [Acetobacter conturbans]
MKRILVWQWGRRGGGPRFGLNIARAIARMPGCQVLLSLSRRAEVLQAPDFPDREVPLWPVETYGGFGGLIVRLLKAPVVIPGLVRTLRDWRPDLAICAMTGPLDLLMAVALYWRRVPFAVVVHDALPHPGDGFPFQHMLQNMLVRRADVVVALTQHVARQLGTLPGVDAREIVVASLPPFDYISHREQAEAPRSPGPLRLLMFGRLLAYKGIDLLVEALRALPETLEFELRIVGLGPETTELKQLAAMSQVTVENRWVPEEQIAALVTWADVMVLPYREASQSGVGAVALAAGRQILATRVGGLAEQFAGEQGVTLCAPDAADLALALEALIARGPDAPLKAMASPQLQWEMMVATLLADIQAVHNLRPVARDTGAVVSAS